MTRAAGPPPLLGLKAVALASLGPGPYAAMLLADLGCEVTIVDRAQGMVTSVAADKDPRRRGQRSVALDLKQEGGLKVLRGLIGASDILMEGMRPGVAEKLGFGPSDCLAINPRLVYCRITGWGQDGPLARTAGHDINYIALSGALHAMGRPEEPPPVPLNLLGDYAGGGLYVAFGILAALHQRSQTGQGQVIDGAIIDGVASLSAATMAMLDTGCWFGRGENVLDGGAPWYRTYRTRCGGYVAVGAIEPAFFSELLERLEIDPSAWDRADKTCWPALTALLAGRFAGEDRNHWERVFEGSDACVTPVLSFEEAPRHPHHLARQTYITLEGVTQPAAGPRLDGLARTPSSKPPGIGEQSREVFEKLGLSDTLYGLDATADTPSRS